MRPLKIIGVAYINSLPEFKPIEGFNGWCNYSIKIPKFTKDNDNNVLPFYFYKCKQWMMNDSYLMKMIKPGQMVMISGEFEPITKRMPSGEYHTYNYIKVEQLTLLSKGTNNEK